MAKSRNYDAFVKAYNHFDAKPLSGEDLKRFYIDDFTKGSVNEIITTVRITERFKKLLIIGHRGCGKSTILNKVADELKKEYHIVSFSAADVINMMDVETGDIILAIYLKVLDSIKSDNKFSDLLGNFSKFCKDKLKSLKFEEIGTGELLGIVSFKFKVEPESRIAIRKHLVDQIRELQNNLSEACKKIHNQKKKDVLIIIDDLDKLETKFAENVFFENSDMLTQPEAKMIYTFPLDTYYCDAFIRIHDRYADQFIPLVNLYNADGNYLQTSLQSLKNLILKRITNEFISENAMKYVIDMSGGLLRDLVRFMQDACKLAIVENSDAIDQRIIENTLSEHINDYYRVFDFPKYAEKVNLIAQTKQKLDNETLVYLLRYLFVLEYRHGRNHLWYDAHPCMKKALEDKKYVSKTC